VGDVTRDLARFYAAADNHQADHQESIIETKGKLCNQIVSILIDLGFNYSYINVEIVEKCNFAKEFHEEPRLVQLETRTKIRISHWVRSCAF